MATPDANLILKITTGIQAGKDASDIAKIIDGATGGVGAIVVGASQRSFTALYCPS